MKYLILLTVFLSLSANSVTEDKSFYVLELNVEANETEVLEQFLIKTSDVKQPKSKTTHEIFSLKEFEQLSKNNLSF